MIEFILNDKKITTQCNKSMTLVDFIRENRGLKGTKVVCREGDCGACTVLVGTLSDTGHNDSAAVTYHSITSCISPLANAHGKHIVTVEGLNLNNRLNHIQKTLKDNYASQCGFCTPGFVMAMTNYCLNAAANTEQEMLDAIGGNICRCTGYVSILNAAKAIVEDCQQKDQKLAMQQLIEAHFIPEYFLTIADDLKLIARLDDQQSNEHIVAGGTDLYVQKADQLFQMANLRYMHHQPPRSIKVMSQHCHISGHATVSDLFYCQELIERIPELQRHLRLVSSEPIRNMATIAGNFVNASPIADMSIFLLALDAQLILSGDQNRRQVALKEFFLDYKQTELKANEHIDEIIFKLPAKNSAFYFDKVCKREYLDIATVNTAIDITYDKNLMIESVNLAVGGVAAVPKYLAKTCAFLLGKHISDSIVTEALKIANSEISPITDVRGTREYKRLLANQLIKGLFLKLFPKVMTFKKLIIEQQSSTIGGQS